MYGTRQTFNFYTVKDEDVDGYVLRSIYRIMVTTQDVNEFICAVGSFLALIAKNLRPSILSALRKCSLNLIEIDETRVLEENSFVEADLPDISENHGLLIWACLVLAMFKNCTTVNFHGYFQARVKAMKPLARLPQNHTFKLPFDLTKAQHIRNMLGYRRELTREVLNTLVGNLDDNICLYLSKILSWSGMSGFVFVYDCLIITRSPVLFDSTLRADVINMAETLQEISSSKMPQYFRYYCVQEKLYLLDKRRFSLLITVAQRIKFRIEGKTLNNYVTVSYEDQVIERLIAVHNSAVTDRLLTVNARKFRWITGQFVDGPQARNRYQEEVGGSGGPEIILTVNARKFRWITGQVVDGPQARNRYQEEVGGSGGLDA